MNQLSVQLSYFYSLHCGMLVLAEQIGRASFHGIPFKGEGVEVFHPDPDFLPIVHWKNVCQCQICQFCRFSQKKALKLASDCVVICCEVYRSLFRSIHTHSYRSIHLFFHRMCNPNSQSSSRRFPFLNHFQLVRFDIFANLKIWDFEV